MGADIKLLNRIKPHSDESLMGYVLRLTEENGYETSAWILRLAKLNDNAVHHTCAFLFKPPETFDRLAGIAGLRVSDLAPLAYPRVNPSEAEPLHLFFGSPVPRCVLNPAWPKVCPSCLLEARYHRRVWDLLLVTACPIHKCLLVDTCHACGRRLSWIGGILCVCRRCNFDSRESPIRPLEERDLRLVRHLYRLCGVHVPSVGARQTDMQSSGLVLSLGDLTTAVLYVAGQYLSLTGFSKKRVAEELRKLKSESHPLLVKSFSAFESWPEHFYSFLDRRSVQEERVQPSRRRPKLRARKDLGKLYLDLHRKLSGGEFKFIWDAFNDYMSKGGAVRAWGGRD